MFATTSAVQTQTAAAASPRHLQLIPVGSKRRQGALVSSSPVARGCIAATTSNDATGFGATPSISTPIHFTKCFKTGADAPSTGVKYTHARSKSLDECGVSSSDMHKHTKHVFANAVGLDSPLRSRRALPSLSVGAANDETLVGRPGIVYINGTKMPQDGWYQRVSAGRGMSRERGKWCFMSVYFVSTRGKELQKLTRGEESKTCRVQVQIIKLIKKRVVKNHPEKTKKTPPSTFSDTPPLPPPVF